MKEILFIEYRFEETEICPKFYLHLLACVAQGEAETEINLLTKYA